MTLFDVRKQERQALKRHAEYMAGIHVSNAKALRKEKWQTVFFISGMAAAAILVGCILGSVGNTANAENNSHSGETTSQVSQW